MEIDDALAADLSLLTAALDDAGVDIAETVRHLAADAKIAVRSYLGLRIAVSQGDEVFDFTLVDEGGVVDNVGSSIWVTMRPNPAQDAPSAYLILYAARPGAVVDLAADLAWLTGGNADDIVLDEHRALRQPADVGSSLHAGSAINQAVGALIARGHLPVDAHGELARLARSAGTDLHGAASAVLRTV
jgi:hypothetical protein